MTYNFDAQGINHLTVAVRRVMTQSGGRRSDETDTLFLGGARPSEADQNALARFGLRRNYQIVHVAVDPAAPHTGPFAFHVMATDGETEAFILREGRLWKRDRRSAAVLLLRTRARSSGSPRRACWPSAR